MTILEICTELENLLIDVLGDHGYKVKVCTGPISLDSQEILCIICFEGKVIFSRILEVEKINNDVLSAVVVETALGTRVPL